MNEPGISGGLGWDCTVVAHTKHAHQYGRRLTTRPSSRKMPRYYPRRAQHPTCSADPSTVGHHGTTARRESDIAARIGVLIALDNATVTRSLVVHSVRLVSMLS